LSVHGYLMCASLIALLGENGRYDENMIIYMTVQNYIMFSVSCRNLDQKRYIYVMSSPQSTTHNYLRLSNSSKDVADVDEEKVLLLN